MLKKRLLLSCLLCFLLTGLFSDAVARTKFDFKIISKGPRVSIDSEFILIEFTLPIDEESLADSVQFSDLDGELTGKYSVEGYPGDNTETIAWVKFEDNFTLSESSKYLITVGKGLRYVKRVSKKGVKRYGKVRKELKHYFLTTSSCPFQVLNSNAGGLETKVIERTKIVVVSDIHIGGPRATAGKYNWFSKNIKAFESFLDDVANSPQIKELVIAGDLLDEWIMPGDVTPFPEGITSSDDFFRYAAEAETMKSIFTKLNAIADGGIISVVYVPGNHDMLCSETALKLIIPNATWKGIKNSSGKTTGVGIYSPSDGSYIEHGHIYDFFNAPDPFSQSSSILPPGYFISRLFATNMVDSSKKPVIYRDFFGDLLFYGAWEAAMIEIFGVKGIWDKTEIITGIDGYTETYKPSEIRDHYKNAGISDNWSSRQTENGVHVSETQWDASLVGAGSHGGSWGDLANVALNQYFKTERSKIVVFGHTHLAMIKAYDKKYKESSELAAPLIYANSGTWIDRDLVSKHYDTRTYIVINTASTDSALETVSLYQYNLLQDGSVEKKLLKEVNLESETNSE